MRVWQTSDFHFELPEQLIAQRPSEQRGESRLMYLPPTGVPCFSQFSALLHLFRGDEVLVLNDTRVVPARIYGQKSTGGKVEVFFLEIAHPIPSDLASDQAEHQLEIWAMTRGKFRIGHQVHLPLGVEVELIERDAQGMARLSMKFPSERLENQTNIEEVLWTWLEEVGQLPLPPYIQRTPDAEDRERYQTVFAKTPGAIAAPTAGLHFTESILEALKAKGVQICYVTLHVGLGTFLPVKSEHLEDHVMHHERYQVPLETQQALRSGRPIIAVGTTVVRALESFMALTETDPEHWGRVTEQSTDIFIAPGYQWRAVDALITNFHIPQSTLLMLVAALAGYERMMSAYQRAVEESLRFYSYGDSSILCRPDGAWKPQVNSFEEVS